jgi:hypothetical protein
MNATVYKSTGNWYQVKDGAGKSYNARLLGKFKMDGLTSTNPIAVGDQVVIDSDTERRDNESEISFTITEIKKRKNYITRTSGQAFDSYLASLQQVSQVKRPLVRVPLPAALPMAQQPRTVTFLPSRLARVSGLVQLDVPDFQFDWDVVLMTRTGRELTDLEQVFVELVTAVWHTNQP